MRAKLVAKVGLVKSYHVYIISLFLWSSVQSLAQVTTRSHKIDRELRITYDNDLYFGTDQYYTSGGTATYSFLTKPTSRLHNRFGRNDSAKVIGSIEYGHQIFTPNKIKRRDVNEFDRPYAGWQYLQFQVQSHSRKNIMNEYSVELGVVGERSGMGNLQQWYHDRLSFPQPQGWQYQIENEVILNLEYHKKMLWSPVRRIGFYSDTGLKFGNGINRATQEVTVRYGKANRLSNSEAGQSRISNHIPVVGNSDPEEEEGFIFYGIEGQYVMSNIFIEGSLINPESPHTEELEQFVIIKKWGFTYTNYYTTFSFVVYNLSPENKGAKDHTYLSLSLSFRF